MARFRTLKPETFADEKLNDCPVEVRFLFVGLWCFVDDMGRRQYHPKRIKMEVFPGDDRITPKVVDAWMRELERAGVIRIYSVNGQMFFWLPHFLRHQRVDKPSHSDIPPCPQDSDPDCQCLSCMVERGEISSPNHHHNRSRLPRPSHNVPAFTPRTVDEHSGTLGLVPDHSHYEGGREGVSTKNQNLSSDEKLQAFFDLDSQANSISKAEHRRTLQAALDEIVLRMVRLLEIKHNSELLQAVASAITMKSRSKSISVEAAAQQVAARAAFVAAENPPENWEQWFADAGYEYVPQGDPRLKDRHVYARPVCGGSLCQEGWEVVKVGGLPVLRRCQDCERLWRDTSSD